MGSGKCLLSSIQMGGDKRKIVFVFGMDRQDHQTHFVDYAVILIEILLPPSSSN